MPTPRIILMYISEISGHHSATLAVEKAIGMLLPSAEVLNINAFNYTNPISEKIVNRLYLGVIKRTPKIWDYLYDNPKVAKTIEKIKENIHKYNSPKLKNLFDKIKPQVIACSQAFPCGMVADFKKIYNSHIPLVAILTDYIPHSYWIYDTVDNYVVPSEEVKLHLVKKEVSNHKIKVLGIPFDPKFNAAVLKHQTRQRIGLNPDIFTILVMGGGQGLGPIRAIVNSLEKIKRELQVIIITGVNRKLYRCLEKKIKEYKNKVLLLGYVDNIHELMAISDLIITKPGGVTTAEVLAKGLPMVIVKPLPGQEASNTAYLTKKQAALKVDDPQDISLVVEDLLSSPDKLKRLSEAAIGISKPNASLDIARLLLDSCHNHV